jgi:hypothetical protein
MLSKCTKMIGEGVKEYLVHIADMHSQARRRCLRHCCRSRHYLRHRLCGRPAGETADRQQSRSAVLVLVHLLEVDSPLLIALMDKGKGNGVKGMKASRERIVVAWTVGEQVCNLQGKLRKSLVTDHDLKSKEPAKHKRAQVFPLE